MSTRVTLQHFVSTTEPTAVTVGDEWYNPATGVLFKRIASTTGVQWVNISGLGAASTSTSTSSGGTATETISPLMLAGM
jgi:uncharacterized Zn-binding protein involved in type VI secretion